MRLILEKKTGIIIFLVMFFCFGALILEAAVDPVVVELHYQNGVKFYKRGMYERAVMELKKTLSLDPNHGEAKEYLDKVKAAQQKEKVSGASAVKNEEINGLYKEGRRLYESRDYQGAIEVFNKILELKHVDDFASYYKEKSEIFISKKLARERKIEERKKRSEKRTQDLAELKQEKESKKREHKEMLQRRAQINQERRQKKIKKVLEPKGVQLEELSQDSEANPEAGEEVSVDSEIKPEAGIEVPKAKETNPEAGQEFTKASETNAEVGEVASEVSETKPAAGVDAAKQAVLNTVFSRESKKDQKKKARQEKMARIEHDKAQRSANLQEKKELKKKARLEKIEDAKALKEQKLKLKEMKRQEKKEAVEKKKMSKAERVEEKKKVAVERQAIKDSFMKGIEQYGSKDFQSAIATFKEVIDAEKQGKKIFTNSSQRMVDKAKRRLDETEKP